MSRYFDIEAEESGPDVTPDEDNQQEDEYEQEGMASGFILSHFTPKLTFFLMYACGL